MLLSSERHTASDLALWREYEEADRLAASSPRLDAKIKEARIVIEQFAMRGPSYIGVSWGKDSVVVAHLARDLDLPLAWVKPEPLFSPECLQVRDAYLARFPSRYREFVVPMQRGENCWHASGTIEAGFRAACRDFGDRHISGIRADESGQRKLRMLTWSTSSPNSCAPIGWWSATDVFAYLARYDLPVHPVYAMLGACDSGARWERDRLRVCSLGGKRGQGHGRQDWERQYYGDHLRRVGHWE